MDGAAKIKELIKRACEMGQNAVAITDHRNLCGYIEIHNEAKKWKKCPFCGVWLEEPKGGKPLSCCGGDFNTAKAQGFQDFKVIYGCELEETEDRRIHSRNDMADLGYDNYHLIVWIKDETGFKNLMKIISDASTTGYFDRKERTDLDFIEAHGLGKGLICSTACIGGRVPQHVLKGEINEANEFIERLQSIFDEVYMELQSNSTMEQKVVNTWLIEMHKTNGVPLVATKDVHYIYDTDADVHDTLLCIQINKLKDDPTRWRFPGGPDYYLCDGDEMDAWAQDSTYESYYSYAIDNTVRITAKCNFKPKLGQRLMPEFPVPEGYSPETWLKRQSYEGLIDIMEREKCYDSPETYIKRLDMELGVINPKGYASYFLILEDMCAEATRRKIRYGPGRGSAAGSLLSNCLKITKMDPIRHGFMFERFLNPERESMPDIDMDWDYERRGEMIDYLMQKYGRDHVAQIATFGRIGVKSAIRDVMRVRDYGFADTDALAKLIPDKMPDQSDVTLDKLFGIADDTTDKSKERYGENFVKDVKAFVTKLNNYPEVMHDAKRLEGVIRQRGIHAAGVVITPGPVTDYIPLMSASDTAVLPVAAWDMSALDYVGALKLDVLGLKTLTTIDKTLISIKAIHGVDIDIDEIELDDPATYKTLQDGHTHSIFQLESGGMTRLVKDVKPDTFDIIIDLLALYRPGPIDAKLDNGLTMVEQYVENRHGAKLTFEHPDLEPILMQGSGVFIYQEQIIQAVRQFAGYTLGGADSIRRVMGKKKVDEVEALRPEFLHGNTSKNLVGGLSLNYTEEFLNHLFDQIKVFAGYGFNRPHAGCYAEITYQTAWLKTHYATEFMTSQLSMEAGNKDSTVANVQECRRIGIDMLPPDINLSDVGFTIEGPNIRFGLVTIGGVGEAIVNVIKDTRPYTDFTDFFSRVNKKTVNKKVMTNLIKVGAFDCFEPNRHIVWNHYCDLRGELDAYGKPKIRTTKGVKNPMCELLEPKDFTEKLQLAYEKEHIGLYVSGHPLGGLPYVAWASVGDGELVEIGGIVKDVKIGPTKNGNEYARVCLETQGSDVWFNAFGKVHVDHKAKFVKGNTLIVTGEKSAKWNNLTAKKIITRKKKTDPNVKLKPVDEYAESPVVKPSPYGDAEQAIATVMATKEFIKTILSEETAKPVVDKIQEILDSDDPLMAIFGC